MISINTFPIPNNKYYKVCYYLNIQLKTFVVSKQKITNYIKKHYLLLNYFLSF